MVRTKHVAKKASGKQFGRGERVKTTRKEKPESSRRRQQGEYDSELFLNVECAKWYKEHGDAHIIKERTFAKDIDEMFQIRECFKRLDWEPIMDLKGRFYPRLVRMFYANMDHKDQIRRTITTFVKGREIQLDMDVLAAILGVSNKGRPLEYSGSIIATDQTYDDHVARAKITGQWVRPTGVRAPELPAYLLEPKERLLAHICSFNVMPRSGSLSSIRTLDLYFMTKLLEGPGNVEGVPISHIIIQSMRDVTRITGKSMCFPCLLTLVFEHFDVDLSDEETQLTSAQYDVYDKTSMNQMKFVKENGIWVNPKSTRHVRNVVEDEEDEENEGNVERHAEAAAQPGNTSRIDEIYNLQQQMVRDQQIMMDRQERLEIAVNRLLQFHGLPPQP